MALAIRQPVAAFVVLCMAGCVAYIPPVDGPKATIRFNGGSFATIATESTAGKSCIAVPHLHGEEMQSQTIPASKRLWLSHGVDSSGTYLGTKCVISYSFTPEQGQTYVSDYVLSGGRCSLKLGRLTESGAVIREASQTVETKVCW